MHFEEHSVLLTSLKVSKLRAVSALTVSYAKYKRQITNFNSMFSHELTLNVVLSPPHNFSETLSHRTTLIAFAK